MEAKLVTLRSETKQSLMAIRNRLQKTLPNLDRFADDVRTGVSSAARDAVSELKTAHSDLLRLLAQSRGATNQKIDIADSESNVEGSSALLNGNCDNEGIMCQKDTNLVQDALRRICNRLDDMYRGDESVRVTDCKCDLDEVADLINSGASKEALKIVVRSSRNIDDVFKLSAEALERAGGVNPKSTEKLKLMDYAGMCAKYATSQNKSITSFVDDVIYEALLDGKISAADFTCRYETLDEVGAELERDQETVNENAKRFLRLLTKTLIPVTSVVLKVCAIIGLTVFCVNPLTATLLCASALMLDTLNEFVKSRMVLDMFGAYLNATASGECLNEALSNKYVTLVSEALLHEVVSGTVCICHNISKGSFFKK